MVNNDSEAEPKYVTDTATVSQPENSESETTPEMDLKSYPSGKPKRVIIRAKIIHDRD